MRKILLDYTIKMKNKEPQIMKYKLIQITIHICWKLRNKELQKITKWYSSQCTKPLIKESIKIAYISSHLLISKISLIHSFKIAIITEEIKNCLIQGKVFKIIITIIVLHKIFKQKQVTSLLKIKKEIRKIKKKVRALILYNYIITNQLNRINKLKKIIQMQEEELVRLLLKILTAFMEISNT